MTFETHTPETTNTRHFGRTLFNILFASVGYVAIRMVIAPVRIKLMTSLLSKEDYGVLTLVMLTVSFITLLSSLGSLEFMLRRLPGRRPAWQMKTLRTIATFFGLFIFTIAVLGSGILIYLKPVKLGLTTADMIAGALILILSVHLTQIIYFLIGRSQYAQSRLLLLFQADAWFLPLLIFMWFTPITVHFMLWLWVVWLILSLLLSQCFVRTKELLQGQPSRKQLKEILHFGIPLMPMIMGEWIFQMQDRYVLLAFTDLEAVANFTLCFNIAWVGFMTSVSMLDVLITEFYKARNQVLSKDLSVLLASAPLRKAFTMMLRYGLALTLPATLILWIARHPVILLLSDPKFADAADLMRWVAPLPFLYLMVIITGRTLMAIDRGRIVGAGTLCAAGLHLALHLLLTPRMGERGAALAGCIAYGTLALYLGIRARLPRWIDWQELNPLRLFLFSLITGAGLYMSVKYLPGKNFLALAAGGSISLAAMLGLRVVRIADIHHLIASINKTPGKPANET